MSNKRKLPVRDPGRIVIGYIHPGQVSSYFTQSLLGTVLYDRGANQRIAGVLNEWSSANVSNSRNKLVRTFLAGHPEADWLLFVDSDMAWEVTAPEELLAVADPERAPVVGGLCFGADHDVLFPTIYAMGEEDGKPVTMRLLDFPEDTMLRCAATGAAFLLIHRGVLERVREAGFNDVFPWFQETAMGKYPVGEDITFCLRAGLVGASVFVHTGVHIGHHKSTVYRHAMFRAQHPIEEVPDGDDSSS